MGCCSSEPLANESKSELHQEPKDEFPQEKLKFSRKSFIKHRLGRVLDDYEVREVMGQGAFGKVYKAVHRQTSLLRAVKMINKQNISREDHERVLREVQILSEIDHPYIVRIHEVIEDEKSLSIVTELYEGGELFDRIVREKAFSEALAATIMGELMSAVTHCHAKGIVHRDLKPENILFETKAANAHVRVIDFGISRKMLSSSPLRRKYGTPYYIAPEVLKGDYDEKCDVWSCGVILFVLLSGEPPFNGVNSRAILQRVASGNFAFRNPIWTHISAQAKSLISRMLTVTPTARPSAQDVLSDPWIQGVFRPSASFPLVREHLVQLTRFNLTQKFKHAAYMYIASHYLLAKEAEDLRNSFKLLDKDGDGKVSGEELKEGYEKSALRLPDIAQVMKLADSDQNGFIDYTEFLTAAMDWQHRLNTTHLESVFAAFDTVSSTQDRNGSISREELKSILASEDALSDDVWDAVLNEADVNHDGVIDLEEFKVVMLSRSNTISTQVSLFDA